MIEEFYRKNYERLVKIVVRRLDNNFAVAEEVVQESFAKAITFLDAFNPEEREFGAWFNAILNNCVKDAYSKEKSRGMSIDLVGNKVYADTFHPILNITKEEILSSIGTMREGTAKQVISLYFIEGMPPRHICQVLKLESNGYVRFIISTWRTGILKRYR